VCVLRTVRCWDAVDLVVWGEVDDDVLRTACCWDAVGVAVSCAKVREAEVTPDCIAVAPRSEASAALNSRQGSWLRIARLLGRKTSRRTRLRSHIDRYVVRVAQVPGPFHCGYPSTDVALCWVVDTMGSLAVAT